PGRPARLWMPGHKRANAALWWSSLGLCLQVCVIEDDEWIVAAELELHLLERLASRGEPGAELSKRVTPGRQLAIVRLTIDRSSRE
ncbi:MAG: hypothetical protein WB902_18760, partial [Acetobacteraceae bacterium]